MKNKKLISGIFVIGTVFGAVASEQLSNGLYQFKSGDPIFAEEVNANFTLLQGQIDTLLQMEANSRLMGSWNCEGDLGSYEYVSFNADYTFSSDTAAIAQEASGTWSNIETGKYNLNTVSGDSVITVTVSRHNQVRLVTENGSLDNFTCDRS